MTASRWRTWLDRPQNVPFRRVLYLNHLWVGIATGLYILMISLSGSAVVFRRELTRWLMPPDGSFDTGYPLTLRIAGESVVPRPAINVTMSSREMIYGTLFNMVLAGAGVGQMPATWDCP